MEVSGVAAAASSPGVRLATVNVHKGDRIGHIVDDASRDQIGFVRASAQTPQEALRRARAARDRVEVRTTKTLQSS
jgi:hypothetical protein